ncbi:hypothetical protein PVAP13_5KG443414 [Panicum virgatum]|uniref:Uncharacterized protein n=1 Tax=Panicum virgatum TaxID=38727 RepID=A0A8T0SLM0_PANVG|nr:hypothetical protein PVAP13_5KG443414 [Panicum virgatum]
MRAGTRAGFSLCSANPRAILLPRNPPPRAIEILPKSKDIQPYLQAAAAAMRQEEKQAAAAAGSCSRGRRCGSRKLLRRSPGKGPRHGRRGNRRGCRRGRPGGSCSDARAGEFRPRRPCAGSYSDFLHQRKPLLRRCRHLLQQ